MRPLARTKASDAARFDDRPLLVLWETTRACALACRHCRADAQAVGGADDLTTDEAYALLDELSRIGRPRPICILTGGDCLARPDIAEIVAGAARLGVTVAMAPSVTPRLTSTTMHKFQQLGVRSLSVSLDGAVPSTHDAVRGVPGHLDTTLERITMLKDTGFKVQVNTTVMQRNLGELASIASLLHRLGVEVWEVFFVIGTGRGTTVEATSAEQNEEVCNFLVDASRYGMTVRTVEAPFFRRVALERSSADADDVGDLYVRLRDQLHYELGPPRREVRAPSSATRDGKGVVFVAANGDVYPSGFLPLRLGSVRERPLLDIYREHPLLRSIRSAAFGGECGSCTYSNLCGGSRSRAYATSGDPLGDDPGCVLTRAA
jgi:radical SAM protein